MKTELKKGEHLVKEGYANLQKNIDYVDGKLYLTNQRLIFEVHSLNIQSCTIEVELTNIQSSEKCWTKLFGLPPLFSNSLAIYTKDGQEFCFILSDSGTWTSAIDTEKNECLPNSI